MNSTYKTRPGASPGWWLSCLVPACYAATIWRPYQQDHQQHLPRDFKRTVLVTFGLLLQSLVIRGTLASRWNRGQAILLTLLVTSCCCGLFIVCLKENVVLAGVSGLLPVILYDKLFFTLLKTIPKSFTYGEASIVAQGFVVFTYCTFLQLPPAILRPDAVFTEMREIYVILQIGLFGVALLVLATYTFKRLRKTIPFWIALATTCVLVASCPMGKLPAVTRLALFFVNDMQTMVTAGMYLVLLLLTVSFIMWQFNYGRRTTTATRKVFHFLVVLVYGPGLWYQCRLLYLASGLMLAVMFVLEVMARLIQLAPVANVLNVAVNLFIDEKDAGTVALTPLYLLVGCSLPLWLHPVPCDVTNSSGLEMLTLSAGVLSIGIGDTAASVVGYHFGRHKWHASTNKSVEGTVASVLLQALAVAVLYHIGVVHLTVSRAAYAGVAIIVNALVESRTDQIDNLVLPLVTYLVLVCSS
uniref:dolichol kinase n=1 Tax=Anopheles minimus TaxID=112268 RepID=A0A182VZW7_9DIPT